MTIPPMPYLTRERLRNSLGEGLRREHPDALFTVAATEPMTRENGINMAKAHAAGLHAEFRRDACPQCFPRLKTGGSA